MERETDVSGRKPVSELNFQLIPFPFHHVCPIIAIVNGFLPRPVTLLLTSLLLLTATLRNGNEWTEGMAEVQNEPSTWKAKLLESQQRKMRLDMSLKI